VTAQGGAKELEGLITDLESIGAYLRNMGWYYHVFGLWLRTDRPIPGIPDLPGGVAVDVEVYFDGIPQEFGPSEKSCYHLKFEDGIEFVIDQGGTQVWADRPAQATLEDVAIYLLGPICAFLLKVRGIICLHASAVAVGRLVLGLLGAAGTGKSTIAAALALRGHPVLTDDILALRDQGDEFLVLPGPPRLCLWPKSVALLYGRAEALPRLTPEVAIDPEWDKRALDQTAPGFCFQSEPLPLSAIYLLGEHSRDIANGVEAVPQGEGMLALLANAKSDGCYFPVGSREFEVLGRVTAQVSLRRITRASDPTYLPNLCDLILEDFQSLHLVGEKK
jgi:hypothetical protein